MNQSRTESMFEGAASAEADVSAAQDAAAPTDALREAMAHVGEFRAYLAQYLAAKADRFKLSIRKLLIVAMFGVVGLIVGTSAVVTAVVLLLAGSAHALGAATGHPWAGELIVGSLVVAVAALGAWLVPRMLFHSSLKATVKRYERRLAEQRQQFGGADARLRSAQQERAAEPGQ